MEAYRTEPESAEAMRVTGALTRMWGEEPVRIRTMGGDHGDVSREASRGSKLRLRNEAKSRDTGQGPEVRGRGSGAGGRGPGAERDSGAERRLGTLVSEWGKWFARWAIIISKLRRGW